VGLVPFAQFGITSPLVLVRLGSLGMRQPFVAGRKFDQPTHALLPVTPALFALRDQERQEKLPAVAHQELAEILMATPGAPLLESQDQNVKATTNVDSTRRVSTKDVKVPVGRTPAPGMLTAWPKIINHSVGVRLVLRVMPERSVARLHHHQRVSYAGEASTVRQTP